MNNLWLKVKIWTKAILFLLILVYVAVFAAQNNHTIKVWLWFGGPVEHSLLLVLFLTFVIGVAGTLLVRTTLKTIRQMRELRDRSRTERLEKEIEDMKTKADKLQVKP